MTYGEGVQEEITGFRVALANFEGPFDLLLQLIHSHKLDVTEVALAQVTDEFVSYTRSLSKSENLDEITEFLVIAATLLDLKTARLLPRGEVESEEDLALLESQDLLFARLLQYRAYKEIAEELRLRHANAARRYPRAVGLEDSFAGLLPPIRIEHTPHSFAEMAAAVFRPRPPESVSTSHVHSVAVSVPEQAGRILSMLRAVGAQSWRSFEQLTSDCTVSMQVVGRFLALLELFKAHATDIEQNEPLGEMFVAWTGLDVDPAVVAAANWE
ncbi:segregation and condensation protein A [Corynebacterium kroppenstedtii]|uniref:segregation and condensation protein A n=1 Tax=Corynebacterium sp. PCR 32 TaxID=3351342 RepID=UPI0030AB8FDA